MTHALHVLHQEAAERHRLRLLPLLSGLRMLRLRRKPGPTSLSSSTKRRENACLMRRSVQSLHSSKKVLCHSPRTGTTKATNALQIHHFRRQRKSQNRAWVRTLLRRRNNSLFSSSMQASARIKIPRPIPRDRRGSWFCCSHLFEPPPEVLEIKYCRDSYPGWSSTLHRYPAANAPSYQEPDRGGCLSTEKSRRPPAFPAGSG